MGRERGREPCLWYVGQRERKRRKEAAAAAADKAKREREREREREGQGDAKRERERERRQQGWQQLKKELEKEQERSCTFECFCNRLVSLGSPLRATPTRCVSTRWVEEDDVCVACQPITRRGIETGMILSGGKLFGAAGEHTQSSSSSSNSSTAGAAATTAEAETAAAAGATLH